MTAAFLGPKRKSGTIRTILLLSVLSALFLIIGILANDVQARLRSIEQADSDNGQWVMMQTEVEVLRLQYAIRSATDDVSDISEVRRWFDVLYSRINLLQTSPLYERILSSGENKVLLGQLSDFIDRWVPVIDGKDTELLAELPKMEEENARNQGYARALSLSALQSLSHDTDNTRSIMSLTLLRLAITTAAMVTLLGVLALILARLYATTRRQAEENRITSDNLRTIIENSPDAIAVTDRNGHVLEFNPQAEAIFGIPRASVMGQIVLPAAFPPDEVQTVTALVEQAVERAVYDGPQRFELRATRGNGERFPLEVSLALGPHHPDPAGLVVAFMRDVSERHAAQNAVQVALERAQAGEKAKANFIAVMSHEMRTPLNGLIGSVDLLRETTLDPQQQELLRVISISSDILLGHVNSVLDITVTEAGRLKLTSEPFDLDQLIEDCLKNQTGLAKAGGNSLLHKPQTGPLGHVMGDQSRLRQILLNLVGNAVKFTRNGEITLETERQPQKANGDPNDVIEFRIIDTGIGIAPEDCEKIFEDFQTLDSSYGRNSGGTGLGLGIVRRLVRAMGGQMGVESELGDGSVFWVRIPLPTLAMARATQNQQDDKSVTRVPPPTKPASILSKSIVQTDELIPLRILVIEDNEVNRFLLRRYLSAGKHDVVEAKDGLEGVNLAGQSAFDVILTDISMPVLDGVEATKRIRNSNGPSAKARIIALTAHALPDDIARFRAAGMDACMTKPISRDTLLARLRNRDDLDFEEAPTQESKMIDPQPIRDLTDELGIEMAASLVVRMIDDGDATMARLSAMTEMTEQTAMVAHRLAGTCATFGAMQLRSALADIETKIKSGDPDSAAKRMSDLPGMWRDCRAILADISSKLNNGEMPEILG